MTESPDIHILLVDDEPRNLDALEAILDGEGYRLLRAEDADRALRALLDHDVAAILLDIKMPGMSGLELAQIIKGTKRFREIPILFLTAHLVEDADVISGYGAGAVDYMTKPINAQILRHKVAVFADLFRKTRALAELNDKLEERVAARTAELERSEQALRVSARQKDEFLATLAHELRNPLAPLRTGLHLLMTADDEPSPVAARTMIAMNRQLDHVVRLIDDLLDVSRISRGVLELKPAATDLATLVTTASETFRPMLAQRGVTLAVETAPITATVDPTRIAQIISNLLHNASKFTPEGGRVRCVLTLDGDHAVVTISDTGVGVAPEQLARIFEMFARAEGNSLPSDRGAGIGLALAKRLAQLHHGDLSVASEGEDRGTTFTLRLPGASPSPPVEEPVRPTRKPRGPALDILVIEDNDDVADTMQAWLEMRGHKVAVARTGPEGLAAVLADKPQLVLCDIGLPGIDGNEVCKGVRAGAVGFRPIMVALTGWGQDEDRARTREAGFDHHLVKPVVLDQLSEVLAQAAATLGLTSP